MKIFVLFLALVGCGRPGDGFVVDSDFQNAVNLYERVHGEFEGDVRYSLLDVFDMYTYESVAVCKSRNILVNRGAYESYGLGVQEPAVLHALLHCGSDVSHREGKKDLVFDRLGNKDWFPKSIMTGEDMIEEEIYLLNRNYYLEEVGL